MFTWENAKKMERFTELECEVWRTQDMGSAAYREIGGMLPSDWGYEASEHDRRCARRMLMIARSVAEKFWT